MDVDTVNKFPSRNRSFGDRTFRIRKTHNACYTLDAVEGHLSVATWVDTAPEYLTLDSTSGFTFRNDLMCSPNASILDR